MHGGGGDPGQGGDDTPGHPGDVHESPGPGPVKRSLGAVVGFVGPVNVNVAGHVVVPPFTDEGSGKGPECAEASRDAIHR
ncbi:hypothetical protein BGL70_04740 [Helicobacter pylori]|nr:hypothetical protein BGL70_04740 [Helicobacter pylori]